jgi:diguanylate cyclase
MRVARIRQERAEEPLYDVIGAFLEAHGLSPDPAHYSFAHAALTDPAMAAAVARLTEGGVRLGRSGIESLGGSVALGGPSRVEQDRSAAALVARTSSQVDAFMELMRGFEQETRAFGEDLAVGAAAIHRQPATAGLDEIARTIDAMSARVRDAEMRLASATAEADALRAALSRAQDEARRDLLTGLPNRLAFEEAFAAMSGAGPHCLGIVDIDHFKRLNDRHGHAVGDRVLQVIARGLANACEGQLVARHGGEEFAVLFSGCLLSEAVTLLDGARAELSARRLRDRDSGGPIGQVTFSAGLVAVEPREAVAAALARADRLLYLAKAQGRDQLCWAAEQ